MEIVVLTLAVSGSVSDYSDTSHLQSSIAINAGVDTSSVSISVAAASVIITATIAIPTSTTADAVQTRLSLRLGTAAAASTTLGITVESDPSVTKLLAATPTAGDDTATPTGGDGTDGALAEASGGGAPPIAAIGGGAAVAVLLVVFLVFLYLRKKRTAGTQSSVALTAVSLTTGKDKDDLVVVGPSVADPPPPSSVALTPVSLKAAAPQTLAAHLAACGLKHHEKAFKDEGYTLDNLLEAMQQGEEVANRDLRELKLTLGERRQLIAQLGANK